MRIRVANGHIVAGRAVLAAATIHVERGRILMIDPRIEGRAEIDLDGGWLVPGFIDTQVNGGGGVLFNDDISVEAIAAIGAAHARFGTTALLPTLISDSPDRIAAALDAADAAIAAGVPGVVGVHIEGPFINAARRGIHDDAARVLMERLDGKIAVDHATARRLFTLICVLHIKA